MQNTELAIVELNFSNEKATFVNSLCASHKAILNKFKILKLCRLFSNNSGIKLKINKMKISMSLHI